MRLPFNRADRTLRQQQARLAEEAETLEFELSVLKRFLNAAPQLQEESQYLVPPPEEPALPPTAAPNRADLKRIQRESYYYGVKLVLLLSIFLVASIWFVDRMLAVMR